MRDTQRRTFMYYNTHTFRSMWAHWLFLALGLISYSAFAEDPTVEFTIGITAFAKGELQTALAHFKQAELAGMNTSVLHYNLGVCYYKLHDYAQAKKYFVLTGQDPRMAQLANYNLGLTALREGDDNQASSRFELAAAPSDDPKLTALAKYQLNKLDAPVAPSHKQLIIGGTIAYGYDDNVNLLATEAPQHQGDQYREALLHAKLSLSEHARFNGLAYLHDYRTVNVADFNQISADFGYEDIWHSWQLLPEVGVDKSALGGYEYQTVFDFKFSIRRSLENDASLLLRYRYSNISADNAAYDYLEGSRQQWRIEYRQPALIGKVRLRYELEDNDRQNSPTANYSPARHDFRLRLEQKGGGHWEFREELQYRLSLYGETAGVTREDGRKTLLLQAIRILTGNISLGIKYAYTDNTSNIADNTYTRNDIQLYTDFLF